MYLTPTIDKTGVTHNGINPHDVLLATGIDMVRAGFFQYATTTALYQLVGGNSSQLAALDMAYVTEDDSAGTITIKPDPNLARVSQLAVMYVGSNLYSINVGGIDIQLQNGGSQVTGKVALHGEGIIEVGTVAITATFQGILQS